MSAQSILEAQTEALLRRLVHEQEQRCRKAVEAAEEQAQQIVARAYQDARARVRQAVAEERRNMNEALAAKRAELETAALKRHQETMSRALESAWTTLRAALAARWEDPGARAQWTVAAARSAAQRFIDRGGVTVELDELLDAHGAAEIRTILAESGLPEANLRRIGELGPGLRIRSDAVCVDATLEGLLRSRRSIEALLLAELTRGQTGPGTTDE